MRTAAAGNLVAWAVIVLMIAAAFVLVQWLGPAGLVLLGALTWFICLRAEMDENAAGGGVAVFRARMARDASVERRASAEAERHAAVSPFRFYARCGMVLVGCGLLGLAWQYWRG